MRVLVFGGTGAMGVSLVSMLAARGDEVYVTSRLRRESDAQNVHYIQGNAQDISFLREFLQERYDAIVDFMYYPTEKFRERRDLLLAATEQYIFLSSSRVYADSSSRISEASPRLLDACGDSAYLQTDEYALSKARSENLLRESGRNNWTIVRPYITYSDIRMQLGVYEKEIWLYRALKGRTVVFSRDIAACLTTMTFGEDVARRIIRLLGNAQALGETVHITTAETLRWSEVLEIYRKAFRSETGRDFQVKWIESAEQVGKVMGNTAQIRYDRLYNRAFDNGKILSLSAGEAQFVETQAGLESCLRSFLRNPSFRSISWKAQACFDRLTGERTPLSEIPTGKSKIIYLLYRCLPFQLYSMIDRARHRIRKH